VRCRIVSDGPGGAQGRPTSIDQRIDERMLTVAGTTGHDLRQIPASQILPDVASIDDHRVRLGAARCRSCGVTWREGAVEDLWLSDGDHPDDAVTEPPPCARPPASVVLG